MVKAGDHVVVESEKVGQEPRSGVVTSVEGSLVHVRWNDGSETSFVPSAGAMRVVEPRKG